MVPNTQFSVLIPYFEKQESIPFVLEALERSSDAIQEILLFCDGCEPPEISQPKLRIIAEKENRGLVQARNRLLREAGAENILFLDADAVIQEGFFDCLAQSWNKDGFFAGREVSSPSEGLANQFRNLFWVQTLGDNDLETTPIFMGICFGGLKTDFLRLGGFNPKFRNHGEDLEFSLFATQKGLSIQYLASLRVKHLRWDGFLSLRTMIREHCQFQIIAHKLYKSNIIEIMVQSVRWIAVAPASSLLRHRSLGLVCLSFLLTVYALAVRVRTLLFFKAVYYERKSP
jgi:GT2 family glycosyltransferase